MHTTADDLLMHRFMRGVDRHRWWLFAAILALYLVAFNGQLRVTDDNAWYTTTGINLAEDRGYTYHGQPDTVSFPGVPLMVAAGRAVFAGHGMAITHALLMGMSLLTLFAAYRLFLWHVERSAAVLAVTIFACLHTVHEHAVLLLTDGPFALGVVLALWGFARITRGGAQREQNTEMTEAQRVDVTGYALLAAGLGVAVVSRVMMMALVLALGIVCLWRVVRGGQRARHVAIGVLTLAVVFAFYLLDPRKTDAGYTETRTYEAGLVRYLSDIGFVAHQSLTRFVPMLFDDAVAKAVFGIQMDPVTCTIFSIFALSVGVIGAWGRPLWAWFFAINIAVMLVFTPSGRYFLPLLPIIALGLARLFVRLGEVRPWLARHTLPGLVLTLVLTPNIIKNLGTIIEQRSTPFYEHYHKGRYVGVQQLGEAIREHVPADALVLSDHAAPLTMFAGDERVIMGGAFVRKRRTAQQVFEFVRGWRRVYVVQPAPPDLQILIDVLNIELGPAELTVPRLGRDTPWTLHAVHGMSRTTDASAHQAQSEGASR